MSTIITFSGLDGSGKSTMISMIGKELKLQGYNTSEIWYKFGELYYFKFLSKLFTSSKSKLAVKRDNPFRYKNKIVEKIALLIYLLDQWIFTILKLREIHKHNTFLLCDRYVADTYVDLQLNFNLSSKSSRRIIKILRAPKPTHNFYLKISPDLSMRRKTDFYSIYYLRAREKIYENLISRSTDWIILDSMNSKSKLLKLVKNTLKL